MKKLAHVAAALFIAATVLAGCSSRPLIREDSILASEAKVGAVNVKLDEVAVPKHRHAQFHEYHVDDLVKAKLVELLTGAGKYADGGALTLDVTITDYHLRESGEALMLGAFAPDDKIRLVGQLKQGDKVVSSAESYASTSAGGWMNPAETDRLGIIIPNAAKRLIQEL
ncbi:MAG: hypothetical protein GXP54_11205 [Deltaproteobacteria bacterium]|nr:hypothetical protein [Deltaproteobacteria bacterium]